MAKDSWVVDIEADPERFVSKIDVSKVKGRQSFINEWLNFFSTDNGQRLAVKLKDRPDLMESLWQAFSKREGVSDNVIEQAQTDGVKWQKAFKRATKKYTKEALELIKKFDARVKKNIQIRASKRDKAPISAYAKSAPQRFTQRETDFLKNHLFENINDVYLQYIKVFDQRERTLSSIESKLSRLRKELG